MVFMIDLGAVFNTMHYRRQEKCAGLFTPRASKARLKRALVPHFEHPFHGGARSKRAESEAQTESLVAPPLGRAQQEKCLKPRNFTKIIARSPSIHKT